VAADAVTTDEAGVPAYELPAPLVYNDGSPVADAWAWTERRRPEVLELFREQVYGRTPDGPEQAAFEVTSVDRTALGGQATRKLVAFHFEGAGR
jgi:hypothetical protein